jgi:hypothetical protein
MTRRTLALLIAAFLLPGRALAVFGEEDWLSGQNVILGKQLAQATKQTAELIRLVQQARDIASAANESAAYARAAYRQLQYARVYTPGQFFDDMREGFYQAFPELEELDREVRAGIANGEAIAEGRFWTHTDHHDRGALRRLEKRAKFALKGTIWTADPQAGKLWKPAWVDAANADYFQATGQRGKRAVQARGYLSYAEAVKRLKAKADEGDHLPTLLGAQNAAVNTQTMRNTTEMLDHQEAQTAREWTIRKKDAAARKQFVEEMREAFKGFGRIRSVQDAARRP